MNMFWSAWFVCMVCSCVVRFEVIREWDYPCKLIYSVLNWVVGCKILTNQVNFWCVFLPGYMLLMVIPVITRKWLNIVN